jgi:hypothetical protein
LDPEGIIMRLRMPDQKTQERRRIAGNVIRMKGSARRKMRGRNGNKKKSKEE